MDRKGVVNLLNNLVLAGQTSLSPLDEFYKEFELWIEDIRVYFQKFITGKYEGNFDNHMRRLSIIRESPGCGESRDLGQKSSEVVAGKYKRSSRSRPKRSKLHLLAHNDESEEETGGGSGNHKKSEHLPSSFISTESPKKSSESKRENLEIKGAVTCESKRSAPTRRSRRTYRSYILNGRNESLPVRRVTRSVAAAGLNPNTQRTSSVEVSLQNAENSQVPLNFEDLEINGAVTHESKRSASTRRGRRTYRSYILNERDESLPVRRVTRSVAAAAAAGLYSTTQRTSSVEVSLQNENSHIPLVFNGDSAYESLNIESKSALKTLLVNNEEQEGGTVKSRGRLKIRKTQKNNFSSENKKSLVSQTAISNLECTRSSVDSVNLSKQVIKACVVSSTKRSSVSTSESNTEKEKESAVVDQIETQDGELNFDDNLCKKSNMPLVKVEKINNSILEKIVESNVDSTENRKVIAEKDSVVNARKRSLSNVTDNHPRKKSNFNTHSGEIVIVNDNESSSKDAKTTTPQCAIEFQKESKYISQTRKNSAITVQEEEIHSFSQISPPASGAKEFENIFIDEETEKEVGTNKQKVDSGRGNSIMSKSESSTYYSFGGKVDSVTIPENEEQDKESDQNSVVLGGTQTREAKRLKKSKKLSTREIQASCKRSFHATLFSPYANESVKKRVAAYEVLSNINEKTEILPSTKRVTRTKTRAMAAAVAAAGAKNNRYLEGENQKLHKNCNGIKETYQKLARTSVRLAKKRLNAGLKSQDLEKENSFNLPAETSTCSNFTPLTGKPIFGGVYGLSASQHNSSRMTPMTVLKSLNSMGKFSKPLVKSGVVVTSMETFIKRPLTKTAQDLELRRLAEIRKREEKEKETLRRREENLIRRLEEKKKKRHQMRQRVMENREAQEKEKQQIQSRIEKQKTEKWNILQHEREATLKEKVFKKKLETERKAAEARRKLEEAEAVRIAKKKLEEQQKREIEEVKCLRKKDEQNEASEKREIFGKKLKEKQLCKGVADKPNVLKITTENLHIVGPDTPGNNLTGALDSTYNLETSALGNSNTDSKILDSTFNIPSIPTNKSKCKKKFANVYNLEDLPSGDSDAEDDCCTTTAYWASNAEMLKCSRWEKYLITLAKEDCFSPGDLNMKEMFPNKLLRKRTSSAIWRTPPRYSTLPKY